GRTQHGRGGLPAADQELVAAQAEVENAVAAVIDVVAVAVEAEHGSSRRGRPYHADLALAIAVPVADDEGAAVESEVEVVIAVVEGVVAIGVERELGHACRGGTNDTHAVEAEFGPVADEKGIRRQAEFEHGVGAVE